MSEARIVKVGEREVKLDAELMKFSEHTLSQYMEQEAAWYDYFGSVLADAEYIMHRMELAYDSIYSERYKEHKESGCTEKLAEANSKADSDVENARKDFLAAKHKVRLIQQHLRAWDKSHENAQSRGHFLRKEMDKLNKDVYLSKDVDARIDEIIKEADLADLN